MHVHLLSGRKESWQGKWLQINFKDKQTQLQRFCLKSVNSNENLGTYGHALWVNPTSTPTTKLSPTIRETRPSPTRETRISPWGRGGQARWRGQARRWGQAARGRGQRGQAFWGHSRGHDLNDGGQDHNSTHKPHDGHPMTLEKIFSMIFKRPDEKHK